MFLQKGKDRYTSESLDARSIYEGSILIPYLHFENFQGPESDQIGLCKAIMINY